MKFLFLVFLPFLSFAEIPEEPDPNGTTEAAVIPSPPSDSLSGCKKFCLGKEGIENLIEELLKPNPRDKKSNSKTDR